MFRNLRGISEMFENLRGISQMILLQCLCKGAQEGLYTSIDGLFLCLVKKCLFW